MMTTPKKLLQLDGLCKSILTKTLRAKNILILKDISFDVREGDIIGIIGVNGAGKSTLLKTIMGFLSPSSGNMELATGVRIGYLPENPYYYDYLTLKELLWFAARASGMSSAAFREILPEIVLKVGLSGKESGRLRTFSKGMTQRAGLAAAIIHNPDLVILDEPMSGLDPIGRKLFFDLILDLKIMGKTILFCSHILTDVERLCDHVLVMHQGRIQEHIHKTDLEMTGHLQVLLEPSQQASDWLASLPPAMHVLPEKNGFHCLLSDLDRILKEFKQKHIRIESMEAPKQSLEDLFWQITRSAETGGV